MKKTNQQKQTKLEEALVIADAAIREWRTLVKEREGGQHSSPRFFSDTRNATIVLKKFRQAIAETERL